MQPVAVIDIDLSILAAEVRREVLNQSKTTAIASTLTMWVAEFEVLGLRQAPQEHAEFSMLPLGLVPGVALDFRLLVRVSPGIVSPFASDDEIDLRGYAVLQAQWDCVLRVDHVVFDMPASVLRIAVPAGWQTVHSLADLAVVVTAEQASKLDPATALVRLLLQGALRVLTTIREQHTADLMNVLMEKPFPLEVLVDLKPTLEASAGLGELTAALLQGNGEQVGAAARLTLRGAKPWAEQDELAKLTAKLNNLAGFGELLPTAAGRAGGVGDTGSKPGPAALTDLLTIPAKLQQLGAALAAGIADVGSDFSKLLNSLTSALPAAVSPNPGAAAVPAASATNPQSVAFDYIAGFALAATDAALRLVVLAQPTFAKVAGPEASGAMNLIQGQFEAAPPFSAATTAQVGKLGVAISFPYINALLSTFLGKMLAEDPQGGFRLLGIGLTPLTNERLRVVVGLGKADKVASTYPHPGVESADILVELALGKIESGSSGVSAEIDIVAVGLSTEFLYSYGQPRNEQTGKTQKARKASGTRAAGQAPMYWIVQDSKLTEEWDELVEDVSDLGTGVGIVGAIWAIASLLTMAAAIGAAPVFPPSLFAALKEIAQLLIGGKLISVGYAVQSIAAKLDSVVRTFFNGLAASPDVRQVSLSWQGLYTALPKDLRDFLQTTAAVLQPSISLHDDNNAIRFQCSGWPARSPKKFPVKPVPAWEILFSSQNIGSPFVAHVIAPLPQQPGQQFLSPKMADVAVDIRLSSVKVSGIRLPVTFFLPKAAVDPTVNYEVQVLKVYGAAALAPIRNGEWAGHMVVCGKDCSTLAGKALVYYPNGQNAIASGEYRLTPVTAPEFFFGLEAMPDAATLALMKSIFDGKSKPPTTLDGIQAAFAQFRSLVSEAKGWPEKCWELGKESVKLTGGFEVGIMFNVSIQKFCENLWITVQGAAEAAQAATSTHMSVEQKAALLAVPTAAALAAKLQSAVSGPGNPTPYNSAIVHVLFGVGAEFVTALNALKDTQYLAAWQGSAVVNSNTETLAGSWLGVSSAVEPAVANSRSVIPKDAGKILAGVVDMPDGSWVETQAISASSFSTDSRVVPTAEGAQWQEPKF